MFCARMRSLFLVRAPRSAAYGMRGIVAFVDPQLTAVMRQKQARKEESLGVHLTHATTHGPTTANGQDLKGVSRLVNPQKEEPEVASAQDDPGERNYLGRLLHVADEALHQVKRDGNQRDRKRRGRVH